MRTRTSGGVAGAPENSPGPYADPFGLAYANVAKERDGGLLRSGIACAPRPLSSIGRARLSLRSKHRGTRLRRSRDTDM